MVAVFEHGSLRMLQNPHPCNTFVLSDTVQLHGLSSSKGQSLNGSRGCVVSVPESKDGRYGVRIGLDAPISVKVDNLKLVSAHVSTGYELPYALREHKKGSHLKTQRAFKLKCCCGQHKKDYHIDVARVLNELDEWHSPGCMLDLSGHHILFMDDYGNMKALILPEDEAIWQKMLAANTGEGRCEHVLHPQDDWLVHRCRPHGKMFALRYHVFGQDVFTENFLSSTITGEMRCGNILSYCLSSERLHLKTGWCHESILVFAEFELMRCAGCKKPAMMHCPCGRICYCGRACQKSDWIRHKEFCNGLRRSQEDSAETPAPSPPPAPLVKIFASLQRARQASDWADIQATLRSLPDKSKEDACYGMLRSESILSRIADSLASVRGQNALCPSVHLLLNLSESVGPSAYRGLSLHHSLFAELCNLLLYAPYPLSHEFGPVWSVLKLIAKYGDAGKIAQTCVDVQFPNFWKRLLQSIEEKFDNFAIQSAKTNVANVVNLAWLSPIMFWGFLGFNSEAATLKKQLHSLFDLESYDSIVRIVDLMSSSTHVNFESMAFQCLLKPFQQLCNCAYHEEFAPCVTGDLRMKMQGNRLIQSVANSMFTQLGPSYAGIIPGTSGPPSKPPGLWPPLSGKHVCIKCSRPTDAPVRCPRCKSRTVVYCSAECRLSHESMHSGTCMLAVPVAEMEGTPDKPTAANSSISAEVLQQRTACRTVHILEYSRSPESFRHCLLNSALLRECQTSMQAKGYQSELPSGAKLFVNVDIVEQVLQHLQIGCYDLKPRHVIVCDTYEEAVSHAVRSLRSSDRVKQKSRNDIVIQVHASDAHATEPTDEGATSSGRNCNDAEQLYLVKRTFIHIPYASSLWSGPSAGQKTVSSTDAQPRMGPNPRQSRNPLRFGNVHESP